MPGLRNRGHSTALVTAVMSDITERGLSPSVRCPFIRSYLRTKPDLAGAVSVLP